MSDGTSLSEFVERAEPTVLPLTDRTAFINVWQQRLADANASNLPDYKHKAQKILKFLAELNASLTLLIWPRRKLGALFEPNSCDFLLLD